MSRSRLWRRGPEDSAKAFIFASAGAMTLQKAKANRAYPSGVTDYTTSTTNQQSSIRLMLVCCSRARKDDV
jgi:hypothetical protein